MAGRTCGPRYLRRLAERREEALGELVVIECGLWSTDPPKVDETVRFAVLHAPSHSELASELRGWENGHLRDFDERAEALREVVETEFGIPRRQLRAEWADVEEL